MPVQGQTSAKALRESLYRAANQAATEAVTTYSKLRGEQAAIVGRRVVLAVEKPLNAAHIARILGTTQTESTAAGMGAFTLLALHLVVNTHVIRHGSTVSRVAAGTALVGHLAFYWYSQARDRQLKAAAAMYGEKP